MPFPFDGEQTIGILSSNPPITGGSILPFVPNQNQQDPPPHPLDNDSSDFNDMTYEELMDHFWEWYYNNYQGPWASAFDIWYSKWLTDRTPNPPDEPEGESSQFSFGSGRTPTPWYILIRAGYGRARKYKKRVMTPELEEKMLKHLLDNQRRREEERKALCEEYGNYMFVIPNKCDKEISEFKENNNTILNVKSEHEWNNFRRDRELDEKIQELGFNIINMIISRFGNKSSQRSAELLGLIKSLSDIVINTSALTYSYECFQKAQEYLRDTITLMELDCALDAAQDWLDAHSSPGNSLTEFPCEENQSDYLSLKRIRENLSKKLRDLGEYDCASLA